MNIFIFARKSSKRIKNKNLKKINKKSLIEISILHAKKIQNINKIYISTDDTRIKKIAKRYNCEVINRPKALSTDKAYEWLAWKHAVRSVKKVSNKDFTFISLPTTSPLRSINDIIKGIKLFKKSDADIVISCAESKTNPLFNMIKINKKGYCKLYDKTKFFKRSQDAPKVYDIVTSFYITTSKYILRNKNMLDGKVKAVKLPIERSLDIDTDVDLLLARSLVLK